MSSSRAKPVVGAGTNETGSPRPVVCNEMTMINWYSEHEQTFLNRLCEFAIGYLRSYGMVSLVQNLFFVPIILEESKCTRAQVSSDPGESLNRICIASGDPELKSIVRFRERTNASNDRSKGCAGVIIDGLTSIRRTHLHIKVTYYMRLLRLLTMLR